MGSESKSSSQSASSEVTDSYNQTLTNSLTGTGGLGISNTGSLAGATAGPLSYAYDSNNPITTNNTNNNQVYNLGANGVVSPTNTNSPTTSAAAGAADPSGSGFDWSQILIWVVGGVALWLVIRYGFGDKNE